MPMRLDLHIHSTASDGVWTPAAVVRAALGRLDVIALTDHDTLAGVEPARSAAAGLPLQVIPAVELSSTYQGRDVHILGYFVDPASPVLRRHEERALGARERRMLTMLLRLGQNMRPRTSSVSRMMPMPQLPVILWNHFSTCSKPTLSGLSQSKTW